MTITSTKGTRRKGTRSKGRKTTKMSTRKTGTRKAKTRKAKAQKASARKAGKHVYSFLGVKAEGDRTQRNLLGGKGANLAEMCRMGLPVPPGFTITTEVCTYFQKHKGRYHTTWRPCLPGRTISSRCSTAPRARSARSSASRPARSGCSATIATSS